MLLALVDIYRILLDLLSRSRLFSLVLGGSRGDVPPMCPVVVFFDV